MALLFMDGFDAGDVYLKWRIAGGAATTVAGGRFGTGRYASFGGGATWVCCDLAAATSKVITGFALAGSLDGIVRPHVTFWGDNHATQHLSVGFSNSQIELRRGNYGGTLLASYPKAFLSNTFYNLEVSVTIADSGGTCVVKTDGVEVINYTGDTKNGGTNDSIDTVAFTTSGSSGYVDDVYVCDDTGSAPYNTFLGDVRVQAIVPNGAGASTQFTPSTGSNYAAVDELPYSGTDYVSSSTVGHRDTYALSDLSSVNTVFAVQNNVIARKTDTSALSIKPALKSNSTVGYGSTVALGTADTLVRDLRTQDPHTSSAWTSTDVNALEAGFEVA